MTKCKKGVCHVIQKQLKITANYNDVLLETH